MQDGSNFDFSKIHGAIEKAQEKTNTDLKQSSQIPSSDNSHISGFESNSGVVNPNTHGSPYETKPDLLNLNAAPVDVSKVFGFDIETYQDTNINEGYLNYKLGKLADKRVKDPEKVKEAKANVHKKAAINPMLGKIIMIGVGINSQPNDTTGWTMVTDGVYYKGFTAFDGQEKEMLTNFWNTFSEFQMQGYSFTSFNGKAFDLPYIIFRSMIHQIKFPEEFSPLSLLSKYRHDAHCDLMTIFPQELTGNRWLGLAEMAYLFGFKDIEWEGDGHKIAGWYEEREFAIIMKKNMWDIALTLKLYEKIRSFL